MVKPTAHDSLDECSNHSGLTPLTEDGLLKAHVNLVFFLSFMIINIFL